MDTNDESTAPAVTDTNDFDAAFDMASGEPAAVVEPPQEPTDAAPQEPVDGDQGNEPSDPAEPDGKPTDAPAEPAQPAEPQKPTEPAESQKPTEPAQPPLDPKYLAEAIAEAQAKRERETAPQPAAPQEPQVLTAADFLQPQDVAAIEKFKTEWPDEHAAIEKMFQANMLALVGNRFNDFTKQLNGVLAPVLKSVQGVEVNTYRGAVTAAHPDAFDIGPKVAEWIATQPTLVRSAYEAAFKGSDPQAAIELLNLYKAAIGSTGAAPATPASSAAQEPPKPKPAPSPDKVRALAAVPAAQRPKPSGTDVMDFDGAFEEASEQLANS